MEWRVILRHPRHISEIVLVSAISFECSFGVLVAICLRDNAHLGCMVVQNRVCKCSVLVPDDAILQCFYYSLPSVSEVPTSV